MKPRYVQLDGVQKHQQAMIQEMQLIVAVGYAEFALEDTPLYIEVCKSDHDVITPTGVEKFGKRPYSCATARKKEDDERINIVYLNNDKKFLDDYFYNLSAALATFCIAQYEQFLGTDEFIVNHPEDYMKIRTGLGVYFTNKILSVVDVTKALRKEHIYTMGGGEVIDSKLKSLPFDVADKVMFLAQLIGYCESMDKEVEEYWNTDSDLCNATKDLEEALAPVYNKLFMKEHVSNEELAEVIDKMKNVEELLK